MDHECVEAVPRTKRWTDVVGIGGTAAVDGTYANSRTPPLENVRSRLRVIQRDAGVCSASYCRPLLRLLFTSHRQSDEYCQWQR